MARTCLADLPACTPRCAPLAEDAEKLAVRLVFQEASHAGIYVWPDMGHVDMKFGVGGLGYSGLSRAIEAEGGDDEGIVTTAVRRSDEVFNLHGCDGTVLWAECDCNGGSAFRVFILLTNWNPAAFRVEAAACAADAGEA